MNAFCMPVRLLTELHAINIKAAVWIDIDNIVVPLLIPSSKHSHIHNS